MEGGERRRERGRDDQGKWNGGGGAGEERVCRVREGVGERFSGKRGRGSGIVKEEKGEGPIPPYRHTAMMMGFDGG